MNKVRVFLADDKNNDALSKALAEYKNIYIAGTAARVKDILPRLKQSSPQVIILDLKWFGSDEAGWKIIEKINHWNPYIKIIIHTSYPDIAKGRAIPPNAQVVFKSEPFDNLIEAIMKRSSVSSIGTNSDLLDKIHLLRLLLAIFALLLITTGVIAHFMGIENTQSLISLTLTALFGITAMTLLINSAKQADQTILSVIEQVIGRLRS